MAGKTTRFCKNSPKFRLFRYALVCFRGSQISAAHVLHFHAYHDDGHHSGNAVCNGSGKQDAVHAEKQRQNQDQRKQEQNLPGHGQEHAFDWLVAPSTNDDPARFKKSVKSLFMPDSIKGINPDNIPLGTTLVFDNATHKILCHKIKEQFPDRNIKIKGGLFFDVLDECEGISNNIEVFPKTTVLPRTKSGIKNAFAKLDDSLIKIYLMDKVHEQILKGNMSPDGFKAILNCTPMEDEYKARYQGTGMIDRIYGSRQNATDKYAYTYYETENILNRQNNLKWKRSHADEAMATYKQLDDLVKFIKDVADNPDLFRRTHMKELNLLALSTVSRPHGFNPYEKTDVADPGQTLITRRVLPPDMPQPVQKHKEDSRSPGENSVASASKENPRYLR